MATGTMTPGIERVNARRLPVAALVGGVIAAVANNVVLLIAQAVNGGPLMIAPPGMAAMAVTPIQILLSCIVPAFLAAGLLWLLGRFTQRPFRNFLIIAAVALVFSFGSPLSAPTTTTLVALELMHVIAAASIVGALTRMARLS